MKKSTLAWIDLRNQIEAIKKRIGYASLDPILQATLEWLFREEQVRPVIYIQTVIMNCPAGSPATLQKCIAGLKEAGLLSITTDKDDGRRRILKTTAKAKNLLERLSAEAITLALHLSETAKN